MESSERRLTDEDGVQAPLLANEETIETSYRIQSASHERKRFYNNN